MVLSPSETLVTPKPCSNTRIRLICFPHSGGGPSSFAAWPDILDERQVEVVAISAPGHERRVDVPPHSDWKALVGEICTALDASGIIDDVPYAFFGHSFGAIIAYEVALRLDSELQSFRPRPIHLFASAHVGPAVAVTARARTANGSFKDMDEAALLKAVEGFGFLPPEVTSDASLLPIVLPALRSDLLMYESYEPAIGRRGLPCGATAMGGRDDAGVPQSTLQAWAQEVGMAVADRFKVEVLPGGHFYTNSSRAECLQVVSSRLKEALALVPRSLDTSVVQVPPLAYQRPLQEILRLRTSMHPDMDAMLDEHEVVSYKEMMRRIDLFASDLHAQFLFGEKGKVVALTTAHDITYVIAMVGIFAANAIFIAMEAHFPPDLAKEIGEESAVVLALASPQYRSKYDGWCKVLELGPNWLAEMEARRPLAKPPATDPKDLALLMFTSGTTGRPKTIAGTNFFMNVGQYAKSLSNPFEEGCRNAHNVMFVWEVMAPLFFDLTTYIIPDAAVLDPQLFVDFLWKHKINRTLTTPSLMNTILQYCATGIETKLETMNFWYACGEVLSMKTVNRMKELLPKVRVVNDYSTWESGDVAYGACDPNLAYLPSQVFAVAGRLAVGISAIVVDPETNETLPRGLPGELYVGGEVMSDGYYQQPDTTAEKFVEPFSPEMRRTYAGRWYKTGDLARLVGEPPVLEIRGRMDSTVKIRGFKVGIPVVEAAIAGVPGVALCGVVPVYSSPGTVECLCAFVQTREQISFETLAKRIKEEGVKKIPRWMMPAFIRPMPDAALSGGEARKLDRKKLRGMVTLESLLREQQEEQQAAGVAAGEDGADAEASGEAELSGGIRGILRTVWAKSLNLNAKTLNLDENFFDLGGHSSLAAKMAAELAGDYGLPVTVLDIYSNSTLAALMNFVDPEGASQAPAVMAAPRKMPARAGSDGTAMAIAGISGRFPGAIDAEAFWSNLRTGTVSATFLSPDLLRSKGVSDDIISNKEFVPCAYKIEHADKFDHQFFGIGRHEASIMDPQHRVFIEMAYGAMENACLAPRGAGLSEAVVGVFAASGIDGYLVHHLEGEPLKDVMNPQDIFLAEIGSEKDYIATRVAYLLDFTGPAMNVNSACSSALVACAQGAAAITSGECDAALCGASSITFPNLGYRFQEGLVNSVDGYVRPFDAAADGTVFGDSVGAVVLQRQDTVQAANRQLVWGSLLGFAVTNDGGQKAGYAAPSPVGQSRAVMNALQMARVDPWSVSYVECHCTGTRVGDGIEVRGLLDAFAQAGGKKERSECSVALGSVKGNIAHANCAAGVTGLIKLLYMLDNQQLVPTAMFEKLNPKINFGTTPFYVNPEPCSWDLANRRKRIGGVSAFGIGGTNAHAVVEESTPATASPAPAGTWPHQLFPFSGRSPESLRLGAEQLAVKLQSLPDAPAVLESAAYTMQTGRSALPLRKAVVVPTKGGVAPALLKESMPSLEELDELEEAAKKPTVVFVFPGQGSQYALMGRGLYEELQGFRAAVDRCCEILLRPELLGVDLRPIVFGGKEEEFARPRYLQPSLFVIDYAMAELLLTIGVTPAAVGGHSLGEYVAVTVAGLLRLEDALALVVARAKAVEALAKEGAMLSVGDWSEAELASVRNGEKPGLWIGAVNSPVHAVVSGDVAAVDALHATLTAAGRKSAKLHVNRAFHSGLITEAADALRGLGQPHEGASSSSTVPVVSNYTGGWLNAAALKDGTYWSQHMRHPVLWRDNADKLLKQWAPRVVLEVGPGNALSSLVRACVPRDDNGSQPVAPNFVQAMRHAKATETHDVEAFLQAVGQLWEAGCDIKWDALHSLGSRTGVPVSLQPMRLPAYAFKKTSLWARPERSVYVDGPPVSAAARTALAPTTPAVAATSSRSLVRFAEGRSSVPALRAYCAPFAGGSSLLFAPWAEASGEAVEVVSLELPGRGGLADEKMPATDAEDDVLIKGLCRAILADQPAVPYVLVGFSMGGNICAEIALAMAVAGASQPLALYVAGRRPPAGDPATLPASLNLSDEDLAKIAMAPMEVMQSPEFRDHALPLLRADLELDLRCERRLSSAFQAGQRLPEGMSLEVTCGTNDSVAPWAEAQGWQRCTAEPVGLHFMPGGHEFLRECRPLLLEQWRRDAAARLLRRKSAELAAIAALAAPAAAPAVAPTAAFADGAKTAAVVPAAAPTRPVLEAPAPPQRQPATQSLPLYAVRWVGVAPAGSSTAPLAPVAASQLHLANLSDEPTTLSLGAIVDALRAGSRLVVSAIGILDIDDLENEMKQCWRFVRIVQHLLDVGVSGRILVVCRASGRGGMLAGASKAAMLEVAELTFQRIFLPPSWLHSEVREQMAALCGIADRYVKETDMWLKDSSSADVLLSPVYTQRLEPMMEPSTKLPCVPQRWPNGELAVYVLTGATGGLGTAVVSWLLNDQGIAPEQLVLLRRGSAAGGTPLEGPLAKCRVVQVARPESYEELRGSALKSLVGVMGVFHLAGVLDDGIISGMTEERIKGVAAPKCGIAVGLLRLARYYRWPLRWLCGFSSTSSLFGYPGQVNYCAANAVLDHLAAFGCGAFGCEDVPCRIVAINWGPWGEAGMAKVGSKAYEQALREGDTPLKTAVGLRCLAAAVRAATEAQPAAVQFCACDVAWSRSQWRDLPIVELLRDSSNSSSVGFDNAVEGATTAPANGTMNPVAGSGTESFEDFLANYTSSAWSRIQGKSLAQLGLDSLEVVQLRNALNKRFGLSVPLRVVADPSQKLQALVAALRAA